MWYLFKYNFLENAYNETLESVKNSFPQYIRELEGVAEGAQVEFHKVKYKFHLNDDIFKGGVNKAITSRRFNKTQSNWCSELTFFSTEVHSYVKFQYNLSFASKESNVLILKKNLLNFLRAFLFKLRWQHLTYSV